MHVKFCEITNGTRFEFRGRRYEKMSYDVGRDEDRGGNVFHPDTQVTVEATKAMCRVQARKAVRPVVRPKKPGVLEGTFLRRRKWAEEREAAEPFVEEGFAFAPGRRVYEGRLGRGRDRDRGLRAFGTV